MGGDRRVMENCVLVTVFFFDEDFRASECVAISLCVCPFI